MSTQRESKKLGMWLFLVSDSLTLATMLICYVYSRIANPDWPRPFSFSPGIVTATVMTLILLTSSLTMVLAVQAMKAANRRATVGWLLATIAAGLGFIVLHTAEWQHLITTEKITPASNLFGATFFGLTGLHMLHVACGAIYLSVIAVGVARDKFTAEDVETSGIYWHFVDLAWMFIFPLVYLMSVKA